MDWGKGWTFINLIVIKCGFEFIYDHDCCSWAPSCCESNQIVGPFVDLPRSINHVVVSHSHSPVSHSHYYVDMYANLWLEIHNLDSKSTRGGMDQKMGGGGGGRRKSLIKQNVGQSKTRLFVDAQLSERRSYWNLGESRSKTKTDEEELLKNFNTKPKSSLPPPLDHHMALGLVCYVRSDNIILSGLYSKFWGIFKFINSESVLLNILNYSWELI